MLPVGPRTFSLLLENQLLEEVVQALEFDLSFPLIIFLTLANSLLSLVPTPGGVGAVESGVAGLAVRLSKLAASSAAALVLVDRFITYISVILVGAVIFVSRQALGRRNPPPRRRTNPDQTDCDEA